MSSAESRDSGGGVNASGAPGESSSLTTRLHAVVPDIIGTPQTSTSETRSSAAGSTIMTPPPSSKSSENKDNIPRPHEIDHADASNVDAAIGVIRSADLLLSQQLPVESRLGSQSKRLPQQSITLSQPVSDTHRRHGSTGSFTGHHSNGNSGNVTPAGTSSNSALLTLQPHKTDDILAAAVLADQNSLNDDYDVDRNHNNNGDNDADDSRNGNDGVTGCSGVCGSSIGYDGSTERRFDTAVPLTVSALLYLVHYDECIITVLRHICCR